MKNAQNMLETPQVGVNGRAVVDDEGAVGGQPAKESAQSCKGKSQAI